MANKGVTHISQNCSVKNMCGGCRVTGIPTATNPSLRGPFVKNKDLTPITLQLHNQDLRLKC